MREGQKAARPMNRGQIMTPNHPTARNRAIAWIESRRRNRAMDRTLATFSERERRDLGLTRNWLRETTCQDRRRQG